jgi:catechol 2,3-dioxygenase-like lactoylglutathione lyase family enzyme
MSIECIHHVHFVTPQLERNEAFARDFGMHTVHRSDAQLIMKTSGGDRYAFIAERGDRPALRGIGFLVDSAADLDRAVRNHGATPIMTVDRPGGGQAVTLHDPEGIEIELLHGVKADATDPSYPELSVNTPRHRLRLDSGQQRRPAGPARLFRLGHVGLYVRDLRKMHAWYRDVLGLLTSEVMHLGNPETQSVTVFLRPNRGAKHVDHHSVLLATYKRTDCHHISFEVQDFEAQFRSHRFLTEKGYELSYGVGRHPLGSHVFDTWFNPDRYRWETFSDTDLISAAHPTGIHHVRDIDLDVWSSASVDRYFGDV